MDWMPFSLSSKKQQMLILLPQPECFSKACYQSLVIQMSANSMFWQHLVLHTEQQQTQRRFSSPRTRLSRWSLLWEHFQSCVLPKLTALAAIALYLQPTASCQWQCKPLLAFISPTLELIGDCQMALYTLPVSEEPVDNVPWIPTDTAILLQLQGWKITQGTARETCWGWYSWFGF